MAQQTPEDLEVSKVERWIPSRPKYMPRDSAITSEKALGTKLCRLPCCQVLVENIQHQGIPRISGVLSAELSI